MKGKIEKLNNMLKKNWTRVWLVCMIIALGSLVAYAAYTEVSSIKRVVSTQDSPSEPFSSNCMRKDITSRRLTAEAFDVWVCNFDQNFPKDYSSTEITYTMEAELKVKIGPTYYSFSDLQSHVTPEEYSAYVTKAANYSIYKKQDDYSGVVDPIVTKYFNSGNNFTVTFASDTLAANKSSTDIYTVNVDPADLNNPETQFFVFVTADPNGALSTLSARLYATKNSEEQAAWRGEILEDLTSGKDYDFYNYIVTGSGSGTVKIYWDDSVFELNKFFLDIETLTVEDSDDSTNYNGWKMVEIQVNSATKKSRYEIQLFKVQEDDSVADPSAHIACVFEAPD